MELKRSLDCLSTKCLCKKSGHQVEKSRRQNLPMRKVRVETKKMLLINCFVFIAWFMIFINKFIIFQYSLLIICFINYLPTSFAFLKTISRSTSRRSLFSPNFGTRFSWRKIKIFCCDFLQRFKEINFMSKCCYAKF